MAADDVDLRSVVTHQTTQLVEAPTTLPIVVGTLRSNLRDGVIVRRQLDPQVVCKPRTKTAGAVMDLRSVTLKAITT